jgi:hypothetical protein
VVTAIPALIWQARHGWPQAHMGAVVRGQTNMLFGSLTFIPSQLTSAVADAYQALPAEQRRGAVIVTERYIQASALDYNRSAAGLPAIFSPKRGFGYFGAPPDTAGTVLWVGSNASDLQVWFDSVAPVAKFDVRLGMPLVTRDVTVWECVGPTQPWSSMWPKMRSL